MQEGINQFAVFDKLEQQEQDNILTDIFGTTIREAKIINVLLGWAGFGTIKIWEQINSKTIVPLNLSILKNYVVKNSLDHLQLLKLQSDVNEIISSVNLEKSMISYAIGSKKLSDESFKYESSKLVKYKYI